MKVRMIVSGFVQGVGFRYMTKMLADKIGVNGIVRNEPDGDVYIEAVGANDKVEQFIQKVRQSPSPSARIDHIAIENDEQIKNYHDFQITV